MPMHPPTRPSVGSPDLRGGAGRERGRLGEHSSRRRAAGAVGPPPPDSGRRPRVHTGPRLSRARPFLPVDRAKLGDNDGVSVHASAGVFGHGECLPPRVDLPYNTPRVGSGPCPPRPFLRRAGATGAAATTAGAAVTAEAPPSEATARVSAVLVAEPADETEEAGGHTGVSAG